MNFNKKITFILVEPIYSGNIGSCARVIKNFGFNSMILIKPVSITQEAISLASHAFDVLTNAKIYNSLKEALEEQKYDIVIGTTGISSSNESNYKRQPLMDPISLISIIEKKAGINSKIAILFGRENFGLKNDELELCTLMCSIQTSKLYPILNLSHSVGIIAYELSRIKETAPYKAISKPQLERLLENLEYLLNNMNYEKSRTKNIILIVKRIIGRTNLTQHEYQVLIGLLKEILYQINKPQINSKQISKSKNIKNIFDDEDNKINFNGFEIF